MTSLSVRDHNGSFSRSKAGRMYKRKDILGKASCAVTSLDREIVQRVGIEVFICLFRIWEQFRILILGLKKISDVDGNQEGDLGSILKYVNKGRDSKVNEIFL